MIHESPPKQVGVILEFHLFPKSKDGNGGTSSGFWSQTSQPWGLKQSFYDGFWSKVVDLLGLLGWWYLVYWFSSEDCGDGTCCSDATRWYYSTYYSPYKVVAMLEEELEQRASGR